MMDDYSTPPIVPLPPPPSSPLAHVQPNPPKPCIYICIYPRTRTLISVPPSYNPTHLTDPRKPNRTPNTTFPAAPCHPLTCISCAPQISSCDAVSTTKTKLKILKRKNIFNAVPIAMGCGYMYKRKVDGFEIRSGKLRYTIR